MKVKPDGGGVRKKLQNLENQGKRTGRKGEGGKFTNHKGKEQKIIVEVSTTG